MSKIRSGYVEVQWKNHRGVNHPNLGGEENGNPLQYSCLEKPIDRGAWRAIVHGVAKSPT